MAARAIKIGSAGKIFSLTGWKVGFVIAAQELIDPIARAHQFLTFTSAVPLQWAVAEGLALPADGPGSVIGPQRAAWAAARARLKAGLEDAGFVVLPNAATWFVCIDLAASGVALSDGAFSERAVVEAGVASVPVSALYAGDEAPTHLVRLCFTKPDAVLDEAVARLAAWRRTL
jgi:aspartate/methionine/tyrosine aminotransferase